MHKLTNNQKKFLRSRGHDLKPVIIVGQQGLSQSVLAELMSTMTKHELLKIKIRTDDKINKQRIIDEILTASKAHLIQVIGGVIVIYRAFDKEPEIILPRR